MSKIDEIAGAITECTLKVGIVPLRAALTSVVAHADKVRLGDEDLEFARVRLSAGKDELVISATNIMTGGATARSSAMAAVRIEEDSRAELFRPTDGPFTVDLHPAKVRDLVRFLKPVKPSGESDGTPEDTGWAELRLTLETARLTDVSGLWPTSMVKVPVLAYRPDFPDVPGIIGRAVEHAAGTYKPLVVPHGILGRFEVASKAYQVELQAEPTGTAESSGWLVFCGPDFAGVTESMHGTGGSLGRRDKARMRHIERAGMKPALASV